MHASEVGESLVRSSFGGKRGFVWLFGLGGHLTMPAFFMGAIRGGCSRIAGDPIPLQSVARGVVGESALVLKQHGSHNAGVIRPDLRSQEGRDHPELHSVHEPGG